MNINDVKSITPIAISKTMIATAKAPPAKAKAVQQVMAAVKARTKLDYKK